MPKTLTSKDFSKETLKLFGDEGTFIMYLNIFKKYQECKEDQDILDSWLCEN